MKNIISEIEHILICLKEHIALSDDEDNLLLDYIINLKKEKEDYKSRVEKAVEYYKMHQQECVIDRNRDGKLIKDYYLPAQHSKVLLNILQNERNKGE